MFIRDSTEPSGLAPGRVTAELVRDGKVLRRTRLDLSDAGRATWRLTPARPGAYVVRVVTRRSDTVSASRATARLRWR